MLLGNKRDAFWQHPYLKVFQAGWKIFDIIQRAIQCRCRKLWSWSTFRHANGNARRAQSYYSSKSESQSNRIIHIILPVLSDKLIRSNHFDSNAVKDEWLRRQWISSINNKRLGSGYQKWVKLVYTAGCRGERWDRWPRWWPPRPTMRSDPARRTRRRGWWRKSNLATRRRDLGRSNPTRRKKKRSRRPLPPTLRPRPSLMSSPMNRSDPTLPTCERSALRGCWRLQLKNTKNNIKKLEFHHSVDKKKTKDYD